MILSVMVPPSLLMTLPQPPHTGPSIKIEEDKPSPDTKRGKRDRDGEILGEGEKLHTRALAK